MGFNCSYTRSRTCSQREQQKLRLRDGRCGGIVHLKYPVQLAMLIDIRKLLPWELLLLLLVLLLLLLLGHLLSEPQHLAADATQC